MPMSEEEMCRELAAFEPRYDALRAKLEPGDLPTLRKIAEGSALDLATKAIYLASLFEHDAAYRIVLDAAASSDELKRIAAGSSLGNLPEPKAEQAALALLDDPNPALAKLVLRSIGSPSSAMRNKIRAIDARLPDELRAVARARIGDN